MKSESEKITGSKPKNSRAMLLNIMMVIFCFISSSAISKDAIGNKVTFGDVEENIIDWKNEEIVNMYRCLEDTVMFVGKRNISYLNLSQRFLQRVDINKYSYEELRKLSNSDNFIGCFAGEDFMFFSVLNDSVFKTALISRNGADGRIIFIDAQVVIKNKSIIFICYSDNCRKTVSKSANLSNYKILDGNLLRDNVFAGYWKKQDLFVFLAQKKSHSGEYSFKIHCYDSNFSQINHCESIEKLYPSYDQFLVSDELLYLIDSSSSDSGKYYVACENQISCIESKKTSEGKDISYIYELDGKVYAKYTLDIDSKKTVDIFCNIDSVLCASFPSADGVLFYLHNLSGKFILTVKERSEKKYFQFKKVSSK